MNISINAVFRKDRLNSQNAAPVHLRLTQNRKLKHISTGVTLNINEWDFENQRVMGQTPELQALQLRIDTKIDELRRWKIQCKLPPKTKAILPPCAKIILPP